MRVSNAGPLDDDVLSALFLRGARYAWDQCPRPFIDLSSQKPNGHFHYDVSQVGIYEPDGTLAYSAALGGPTGPGDMGLWPGQRYEWNRFRNALSEQAQQAATDQKAAEHAQLVAQGQAILNARQDTTEAAVKHSTHVFVNVMRLVFLVGIGLFLWSRRLPLLRWYYGLTPHPAAVVVHNIVNEGAGYDRAYLDRVLAEVPTSPVEREVRLAQSRSLLETLNRHAAATKARLEEETAYVKSQAGLAEGVEIQQRIKRRLEAILAAQGKTL
jgi:hypothetical protein